LKRFHFWQLLNHYSATVTRDDSSTLINYRAPIHRNGMP